MEIFVVVPAHNEENAIREVLEGLKKQSVKIVVVDDGSEDYTAKKAKEFFKNSSDNGLFCSHPRNQGLGAALKTGIRTALDHGADIILTFDADGQHAPEDIPAMVKPIIEGEADVVLGHRDFLKMPRDKKIGNVIMNLLTWMFYGNYVKDSQSGLRAFSRGAAEAIDLKLDDYGISSEIIREISKKGLRLYEIPIKTIYTPYSIAKGTGVLIGLKILFNMIQAKLRGSK